MAPLRTPPLYSLLLLIFLFISGSNCNCFLPNGTDINILFSPDGDIWVPCATTGDSMCCRTNVTTGADTCVSNGLCHNNNNGDPDLWRESCTDPTWTSPACLQLCVAASRNVQNSTNARWPNGTGFRDAHVAITECKDGSFCCNRGNTDCCAKGNGLFIVDGVVQSTQGTATASPTTFSSTETGSSATATNTSDSDGGSSTNVGAIAGGVVGGIVGLALIIGAVLYFLRRKKSGTSLRKSDMPHELDSTQRLEASGEAFAPTHKYAKHGAVPPLQQPSLVQVPGVHEMPSR